MIGSIATLARWLGPWADPSEAPIAEATNEHLDGLRVRVYWPDARPRATYLIAPGLHPAGADDPRLDRLCRVLAAAGHLVVAPFIPDYLALIPSDGAKRDFARVFEALPRWSEQRPVVFSISFGSLLAFALAAEHGSELDGLVIFGGYADLHDTLRFCLTGTVASSGRIAVRDPLNQPVVMMNLIGHLDPAPADPDAVAAAWRRYVERTWGWAEMKARDRFCAVADELAPEVPAGVRELFHVGVGSRSGALALATAALARFDGGPLDPSPYLPRIRGRVDLVHGIEDDVIPYEQAGELAARLSHADVHVHITGLYGHAGAHRPPWSTAVKELATMLRILRVVAR